MSRNNIISESLPSEPAGCLAARGPGGHGARRRLVSESVMASHGRTCGLKGEDGAALGRDLALVTSLTTLQLT